MFELSISTSIDKQNYINDLFKKLSLEIKKDAGIVVKQNYYNRAYIAIAIDKKKKDYYISKILDSIVFMIVDDYKFTYYKDALKIYEENIVFQSFLKAISIYDIEIDREIIKRNIDFSSDILVDSLFYFRLQELKARWKKTADIINLNQILHNPSSMLDVLKYLTTMSESSTSLTEILISKNQLKLKCSNKNKCFKRNFDGISNFLTELISINPLKINLKVTDSSNGGREVLNVISQIFNDKIYIIS